MLSELNNFLEFSIHNQTAFAPFSININKQLKAVGNAVGVIEFVPFQSQAEQRKSKSIVLSCGVHGNETAPIELLNNMITDIINADLEVQHNVLFIIGNLPSISGETRFVEENLNRLFHYDAKNDTLEARRANELMQIVSAFFERKTKERLHYDLHTAIRPSKNEKFAVYPFIFGKPYDKRQLAFLSACDINTILLSQAPTGTFSCYSSSQHNAHSFTMELGKVMPFGENDMKKFLAIDKTLRNLISAQDVRLPKYEECPLEIYNVNQTIIKQQEDFALHFDADAPNFTAFPKGSVLASETQHVYHAQIDGEAIVFPNADVPIGQRALLTVVPYEI